MLKGARILKTGIAVAISMFICNYFQIEPAIFAAASAVLAMQPSVGLSLVNAREQMTIHFISIGIAVILGLTLGSHPLIMGLSTIIVLRICHHFKWRHGILGGIMATIFVLASPETEFLQHALVRTVVILIGVGTGLLVNITVAPPRYGQQLKEMLQKLNTHVTEAFIQAVHSYLNLDIRSAEEIENWQRETEKLFGQCYRLYDLYRYDKGAVSEQGGNDGEKGVDFYREYLTYNKGLRQRTRDILFLAQERLERRKKAGDLPISAEFQDILKLLADGLEMFTNHNEELQQKLAGHETHPVDEPHIWSKLDAILNRWHSHYPEGSYYLHALVEVSLITYKIRWAAKESVRLQELNIE